MAAENLSISINAVPISCWVSGTLAELAPCFIFTEHIQGLLVSTLICVHLADVASEHHNTGRTPGLCYSDNFSGLNKPKV